MYQHGFDDAARRITQRARHLFLERGFAAVTMTEIALHCQVTRRALYHHYRNKEEIFRAMIRIGNEQAFADGDWAVQKIIARGGNALEVVSEYLDERFGKTRRDLTKTPHGAEMNETAFRLANDLMIEVAAETNRRMAEIVADLCARGLLTLRPSFTPAEIGQLLSDGARGINQMRPLIPASEIASRYHRMAEVILYGSSENSRS